MTASRTAKKKASRKKAPARTKPMSDKALNELLTAGEFHKSVKLSQAKPNKWNPNAVPPNKFEAIKLSMQTDGWLLSQPLLVWRTDTRGKLRMIIIDGEHRWKAANEVGFTEGPMVFLDKLSETNAKALTIKLDNNRGKFEDKSLAILLRDILPKIEVKDPAASLGFTQHEVNKLLALEPVDMSGIEEKGKRAKGSATGIGSDVTSKNAVTKMVPLYMGEDDHRTFMSNVKALGEELKLENITDVVVKAVQWLRDSRGSTKEA